MWRTRLVRSHRMLIGAYEQYLTETCGLADTTREVLIWHVSTFLTARFERRSPKLKSLQPADFINYVMASAHRWKPASRRSAAGALRSFLRWAQLHGLCTAALVESVPSVSMPKSLGIPKYLSVTQLDALLRSFDRSRRIGRRDYAAVLCMARLGLRVGEASQIKVDDINWKDGTLRLPKSKGRRERILPLPHEVGEALVSYLCDGRPQTSARHIFVSHIRTVGTPLGKSAIRNVTRQAFIRAGLQTPSKGTNVLRHTAATQLIRMGATIKEIADVLGHSSIDTTSIYAKVDVPALAEAAAPWPMEATQ